MELEAKLEIPGLYCSLGEGPHWDSERQILYFIDIDEHKIFQYKPHNQELKSRKIDSPPGCLATTDDPNKLVVATKKGIEIFEFDSQESGQLLLNRNDVEKKDGNRFNDGKVDSNGRLWVGTMADNCQGTEGSLICFRNDKTWTLERENVGISNGLAWTSDHKSFYYIDSVTKKVVGFDFDEATGKKSNERVAIEITDGVPDGMTIDSEDYLWVAIWGGQRIVRYDPKTGIEERRVKVASKNVTSCCFGGPNLTTLYITTSRRDTDSNSFPLAGGLFSVEVGILGTKMNRFNVQNK